MKKKLMIIITSIVLLIIIVGIFLKINVFYDKYDIPEEAFIEYANTIELFKKSSYFDLITNTNVEILSDDEDIDTENVGRKKYTIDIKYKRKTYKYIMVVKVLDVTPPKFLSAPSTVTTTVMNVAYPCDNAFYADDYDNKPMCTTIGEYDIETPGMYKLNYELKDSSGNTTTRPVNLRVIEKWPSSSGGNTSSKVTPILFEDVYKEHKTENTMIGIDVSEWQGNIDFNKVKEAGAEFVIIRIGIQAGKNRDYSLDSEYETYIRDAKAAGLKIGVYVYTTALNYSDGVKCARWVLDTLKGEKLDLGISYDWENYNWFKEYEVSLHTISQGYQGFKKTIEKAGYESHFYGSLFYLENFWMDIDEPVWLAHFAKETDYAGKYFLWQRTGNGKINGVPDNYVDINIMYK